MNEVDLVTSAKALNASMQEQDMDQDVGDIHDRTGNGNGKQEMRAIQLQQQQQQQQYNGHYANQMHPPMQQQQQHTLMNPTMRSNGAQTQLKQ